MVRLVHPCHLRLKNSSGRPLPPPVVRSWRVLAKGLESPIEREGKGYWVGRRGELGVKPLPKSVL